MKVFTLLSEETEITTKQRKRHTPEQIVRKLRDADAMLNAGKDQAAVLQALEVSEATYLRWRNQYGGMKAEEAKRLKQLEDENRRLTESSSLNVAGIDVAGRRFPQNRHQIDDNFVLDIEAQFQLRA